MATCSRRAAWLPHVAKPRLQRVRSPACECPQNMPSAWLGPQTNQCRQTRPFTGPWESCDSIRQEHALGVTEWQKNSVSPAKCLGAKERQKRAVEVDEGAGTQRIDGATEGDLYKKPV